MIRRNYESDLEIVLTETEALGRAKKWSILFYTGSSYSTCCAVATYDGQNYRNCRPTDGGIVCTFKNHGLAPGVLCCKVILETEDPEFAPALKKTVIPMETPYKLGPWAGDDADLNLSLLEIAGLLIPGPPGPGVARGGSAGQALVKSSASDYDTQWAEVLRADCPQQLTPSQQSQARGNIRSVGCLLLAAVVGAEADNWPLVLTSPLGEVQAAYTQFRAAPGRYRWSLAINSLSEGNPFVEEAELEPLHRDDGGLELLFTSKRSGKRYALALTIADDAVTDARVEYRMREDQACYLAAGAAFNVKTGYWEYRDLRDITEEQIAYSYAVWIKGCMLDKAYYNDKRLRFTFPCVARPYVENGSSGYAFYEASNLEVALVPTPTRAIIGFVYGCRKLKAIYGANAPNTEEDVIDVGPVAGNFALSAFNYCDSLTFVKLKNIKVNIELQWSASLRTECVAYMIANAANTQAITLTLHPKVYALLSDELKTAAAAKNIALATA